MSDDNKIQLCRQIAWDYRLPAEDIAAVIRGTKAFAGHYDRKDIFRKVLETYPWFTVLQLFSPEDIKELLTNDLIDSLRMPSLRNRYDFIQKRLQEAVPTSG